RYGEGSKCGDGGPAVEACLNSPIAVAVRPDGSMYIADHFNTPPMRKVAADGTISSVAGAPVTRKLIVGPGQSIFTNGYGLFRIDDDRIRSIAGAKLGFGGDGGPALQAMIASGEAERAQGIAIDAEGNL